MESVTTTLVWQSISVEVTYWPLKWSVISHLEIKASEPLPITDTGYRSRFFQPPAQPLTTDEVIAAIRSWLDSAARSPAWQKQFQNSRQGELF
ncbi:MAG: hypothetical protein AAFN68_08585 [Pseudomonadota bacterium]